MASCIIEFPAQRMNIILEAGMEYLPLRVCSVGISAVAVPQAVASLGTFVVCNLLDMCHSDIHVLGARSNKTLCPEVAPSIRLRDSPRRVASGL